MNGTGRTPVGNDGESLFPFPVPELKSRNMRIGPQGILKRSFADGPDDFFRLYQGDPLELRVEIQGYDSPETLVRLYTTMDSPAGEWRELEFLRESPGAYRLSHVTRKRGTYQFRVKYSLDGGQTWYWDRLPFSRVIVDPASLKDIRMYTLIPAVSGTMRDWTDMLGHIADLGFNAVHLLPLTERDISGSPYSARDLFTIDSVYTESDGGSAFSEFRRFVDAAGDRGIKLCFDLTLNHVGVAGRMVRKCPEWIVPDRKEKDGMKRAGCWHMNTWLRWEDLVRIYYDHPHSEIRADLWEYMTKYSLFWAHFAALTGGMVRLDNLHSSHEGFISHLLEELRRACPDLIVMAEFFTDSNTVLKKAGEWNIDLFLANQWENPYAGDLRMYIRYIHDIGRMVRYFMPITTHDTGAPAQLFGAPEAAVPRYAVTALMGTGRTGIVQGTEYGCPEKIAFIGRQVTMEFHHNPVIAGGIRLINRVFAESDIFHHEGNIDFIDGDHGAVLVALRRSSPEAREGFLIGANLDVANGYSLRLDLSPFLGGRPILKTENVADGVRRDFPMRDVTLNIGPCGVVILRCRESD
jgi:hypothetical protein